MCRWHTVVVCVIVCLYLQFLKCSWNKTLVGAVQALRENISNVSL